MVLKYEFFYRRNIIFITNFFFLNTKTILIRQKAISIELRLNKIDGQFFFFLLIWHSR